MAKKILLADDSITIQKVISITFSNEDYELVMAGDGEEALRKAREVRPSLIMVDVGMPGRNGYDVCEAVKNDSELSGTPVMLLAGTFEPLDSDRASQVGADDHIVKPFESQELLDKVNTLVAAAGPSAAEAPAEAPSEAPAEPPAGASGEGFEVPEEMWEEGDFLGFSEEFEEEPAAEAAAAPGETSPPSGEDLEFLDENLFEAAEEEPAPGPSETGGEEPEFVDLEFGPEELKEEPGEAAPEEAAPEPETFGGEPAGETAEAPAEDFPSFEGTFGGEAFDEAPASWADEPEEEAPGFAPVSAETEAETETPEEPVFGEAAIGEPFGAEAAEEPAVEAEAPAPEPQVPEPVTEEPLQVVQEVSEEVEEAARTVEEKAVAGVEEKVGEALAGRVDVPREQVEEIVSKVAREVVREVAWEVVPELAEELIAEELNRIRQAFSKAR